MTVTTERSGHRRARLRFERLPAAYCHPDRLTALLPDGLPATFRDRLRGSARLRHRLSSVLAKRFTLEPLDRDLLETAEGRLALLEGDALQQALRKVGAIWHARTIRKIVLTGPLRHLIERLGRDTHRSALRLVDLAPEADPTESEAPADVDRLFRSIERDGLLAVNAWCRHQPTALAARLRLKLPPSPETDDRPPASHERHGPIIVDRVAMTLDAGNHGHG